MKSRKKLTEAEIKKMDAEMAAHRERNEKERQENKDRIIAEMKRQREAAREATAKRIAEKGLTAREIRLGMTVECLLG